MTNRLRLLGPIDVVRDGIPRPVAGLRRRAILAVLGLHEGEVIGADSLIEIVWNGQAPANAMNALQSHVSYLRREFGLQEIVARSPGYVLSLDLDFQEAEGLIQRSRNTADRLESAALLRGALALWRGQPLAELSELSWFAERADRLERIRRMAYVALADLRLELGEHLELVPELSDLAARHPLDEEVNRQLILALYRGGRQAEAHATYQRLYRRLADELGIDPGPALRDLESTVLVSRQPAVGTPAQLPLAAPRLVARERELARLDDLLRSGSGGMVIAVISGAPGVGKTTLAMHWAHRAAADFPDGQLYVDLRGFHPGSAMDPAEAVCGFLAALGVAPQQVPSNPDAQVNLYRSMLANKRMLLVLDNARDAEQVRPLLPGSSSCVVVVTSRARLTSLTATQGAHAYQLDMLTPDESRALLSCRLGHGRVHDDAEAADDIIRHCAGLPLALATLAARAATDPGLSLAKIAVELDQAVSVLDVLTGGDIATDARAVFSWSYDALTPVAARVFRLLAGHGEPDTTADRAAAVCDLPPAALRQALAELTGAHLLTQPGPQRYSFHDLLRAYAVELAATV